MKLFDDLRTNYGQSTVKNIRDYENTVRKISRQRNHLVFTLRCRDEDITPTSLKLKCPINTSNARDIIKKAQKDLLRERIRVINNKLSHLKEKSASLEVKVKEAIPVSVYNNVNSHIDKSRENEFTKTKRRHVEKLRKLKEKESKKSGQNDRDEDGIDLSGKQLKRWVINLSKYKLNEAENEVLNLGLNFCPTATEIPVDDFIVATEKACWSVPTAERDVIRSKISGALKSAQLPKSNINNRQRKAIKNLAKNKDVLIMGADKGKAVVIMDTNLL
jgi:hypothetical protein